MRRSQLIKISGNIGSGYSSLLFCDLNFDDFNLELLGLGVGHLCAGFCVVSVHFLTVMY